ncbi:hypothetical protein PAT3040_03217 [Paenibacillus agaridevorans]|uniref:Uncharacterized protein n=1 Tax=Paenibacillus agaridevorans TaxID=171404 RepID=A0A2R5ESI8_9BACL|nr:hypothetical protein PAT3040_03217 [Paenibacillus agaridevorans]
MGFKQQSAFRLADAQLGDYIPASREYLLPTYGYAGSPHAFFHITCNVRLAGSSLFVVGIDTVNADQILEYFQHRMISRKTSYSLRSANRLYVVAHHSFTLPSVMPVTKYFCRKG